MRHCHQFWDVLDGAAWSREGCGTCGRERPVRGGSVVGRVMPADLAGNLGTSLGGLGSIMAGPPGSASCPSGFPSGGGKVPHPAGNTLSENWVGVIVFGGNWLRVPTVPELSPCGNIKEVLFCCAVAELLSGTCLRGGAFFRSERGLASLPEPGALTPQKVIVACASFWRDFLCVATLGLLCCGADTTDICVLFSDWGLKPAKLRCCWSVHVRAMSPVAPPAPPVPTTLLAVGNTGPVVESGASVEWAMFSMMGGGGCSSAACEALPAAAAAAEAAAALATASHSLLGFEAL